MGGLVNSGDKKNRQMAFVHLTIWAVLIIAGIVAKRVFDHADWMMLFHMPAAVFLVLGMRCVSAPVRRQFKIEKEKYLQPKAN